MVALCSSRTTTVLHRLTNFRLKESEVLFILLRVRQLASGLSRWTTYTLKNNYLPVVRVHHLPPGVWLMTQKTDNDSNHPTERQHTRRMRMVDLIFIFFPSVQYYVPTVPLLFSQTLLWSQTSETRKENTQSASSISRCTEQPRVFRRLTSQAPRRFRGKYRVDK